MSPWIIMLIGMVLVIHALPLCILLVLTWKTKEERNYQYLRLSDIVFIILVLFLNLIVYILAHWYVWGHNNIVATIIHLYTSHVYANDIKRFVYTSIVCFAAALLFGVVGYNRNKHSNIRKNMAAVFASAYGILCIVIISYSLSAPTKVVLNEICSNNQSIYIDDSYSTNDYIELYNPCIFPCRLNSLYLSDDLDYLHKFSLENYEIAAHGFLIIKLSKTADSFSINSKGENIYLSNHGGHILDEIHCEKLMVNTAYCRMPDGGAAWGRYTCSPWQSNVGAIVAEREVSAPSFSYDNGFYEEAFELELSAEPNTQIYYSLDGSIPDMESSQYTEPIKVYNRSDEPNVFRSVKNVVPDYDTNIVEQTPVDKAFIVTAVAIDENGLSSTPVTKTYFVDLDQYQDDTVISLIADPNDLFGEDGIYVTGKEYDEWYHSGQTTDRPEANFEKYGRDWEIPAEIQFITRSQYTEQRIGMRIMGGSVRATRLKRLSIFARKDYSGSKWISVPLDGQKDVHSFMLREGFANAYFQNMMVGRDVSTQDMKPVVVFLNGEYWYHTYLLEKYNEEYFNQRYHVNEDEVILYKNGNLEAGVESDEELYNSIFEYITNSNMEDAEVYQDFCNIIDIQSYIDYWCFHLFINNLDVDDNKNAVLWRTRSIQDGKYADGKWRWALYDLDAVEWQDTEAYGVTDRAAIDTFSQKPEYAGNAFNQKPMYAALRRNPAFCKQFVLTFMDLINTNFSVENMTKLLTKWGTDITWYDSFFEKRASYIVPDMAREFGLTGTLEAVNLSINDTTYGDIIVNTVMPDLENGNWQGQYYTDYPITVTAQPREGYQFVEWTGDVVSDQSKIEVYIKEGGIQLNAIFKKAE